MKASIDSPHRAGGIMLVISQTAFRNERPQSSAEPRRKRGL
jgi:hypothetical protein